MAKKARKIRRLAKKGLALSKRANIRRNKMAKKGTLNPGAKEKRRKEKAAEKRYSYAQLMQQKKRAEEDANDPDNVDIYGVTVEPSGEEMMEMMDPDDLEYLVNVSKAKKSKKRPHEESGTKNKTKDEDVEEEEEAYEKEQRSFDKAPPGKKIKSLLPIKTQDGIIHRFTEAEEEKDSGVEEEEQEEEEASSSEEDEETETQKEKKVKEMSTIDFIAEREQKLNEKKIRIGCLATNLLESPEERVLNLRRLIFMMNEKDQDIILTVQQYAALSVLQVFHNLLPEYRIEEHNLQRKLKKDTMKLFVYENTVLGQYKKYLKKLEKMSDRIKKKRIPSEVDRRIGSLAIKCLCELLEQHQQFNYSTNIIQALTPFLTSRVPAARQQVMDCFGKLMRSDKVGTLSLEIVKRIDQVVRARGFNVHPDCINSLLNLNIKNVDSLDKEDETKNRAHKDLSHKEKLIKKLMNKKRQKFSNLERKINKMKRKLEVEMEEAEAKTNVKKRSKFHSQIIHLLFGLYIHILKRKPNRKLMTPVLEGLAKFSHLINIEFFSDLLNVLNELMDTKTLNLTESLYCVQTVFTILSGQGEVLTIDPYRFYRYLYSNMFMIDAAHTPSNIVPLLSSCFQMLIMRKRKVSPRRVLAFTKRLMTLSLTLLHPGGIATLSTIRGAVIAHPCTESLMDTDMEGSSGTYNPELEDPEHCNACATSLWELFIVKRHYHPIIRQQSTHLLAGAPVQGHGALPPGLTKKSAAEIYDEYKDGEDSVECRPGIPPPHVHLNKKVLNACKKRRVGGWKGNQKNKYRFSWKSKVVENDVVELEQWMECNREVDLDFFGGMTANMDLNKCNAELQKNKEGVEEEEDILKDVDITVELFCRQKKGIKQKDDV
ncbi:nucleolar complex protein 3 [Oratosquilla oratoria]|uniref:nucleolar complex protein 3 n=1 Tax=Oratosquilla oratoria TaxID=337810 RepID=UPI003F761556